MAAFTTSFRRRQHLIHGHVSRAEAVGIRPSSVHFATTTTVCASLNSNAVHLEASIDRISQIQEFEPIVNVPAATAFLLIAVVFTLLQLRINAVSSAAKKRSEALDALRIVESLQLSGDDAKERPGELQVVSAKREYEDALRNELSLRTIIPGVRIVAPNDPKRDEEQRAAAKRFLGWDGNEFGDDEEELKEIENVTRGNSERKELSGGAQIVLFGVATILIVLLYTLSFDPLSSPSGSMTAF